MTDTDNDISDWPQFDTEPALTEAEIKKAWMRFTKLDLKGKKINLSNHGGDMYEIDATIEQIIPVLGLEIILKIKDAKLIDQTGREQSSDWPSTDLTEARYVFMDIPDCPPEIRETDILLPAGGICVNETWEYEFGGILSIGFIYL